MKAQASSEEVFFKLFTITLHSMVLCLMLSSLLIIFVDGQQNLNENGRVSHFGFDQVILSHILSLFKVVISFYSIYLAFQLFDLDLMYLQTKFYKHERIAQNENLFLLLFFLITIIIILSINPLLITRLILILIPTLILILHLILILIPLTIHLPIILIIQNSLHFIHHFIHHLISIIKAIVQVVLLTLYLIGYVDQDYLLYLANYSLKVVKIYQRINLISFFTILRQEAVIMEEFIQASIFIFKKFVIVLTFIYHSKELYAFEIVFAYSIYLRSRINFLTRLIIT